MCGVCVFVRHVSLVTCSFKMPNFTPEELRASMDKRFNIRNMSVIAHVDRKCSLGGGLFVFFVVADSSQTASPP